MVRSLAKNMAYVSPPSPYRWFHYRNDNFEKCIPYDECVVFQIPMLSIRETRCTFHSENHSGAAHKMCPPKYDERQSATGSTSGVRWQRLVSHRMGFPDLWRSAISVRFHVDTRSYTTVRAFVTGTPRGSSDIIFMHFFALFLFATYKKEVMKQ